MATSSKLQFQLSQLVENALAYHDRQIAELEADREKMADQGEFEARVAEWREEQKKRVRKLYRSLASVNDYVLAQFEIESMPSWSSRWDQRENARQIERAKDRRERVLIKAKALVPDADGNVSLTKTQMDDFFGL